MHPRLGVQPQPGPSYKTRGAQRTAKTAEIMLTHALRERRARREQHRRQATCPRAILSSANRETHPGKSVVCRACSNCRDVRLGDGRHALHGQHTTDNAAQPASAAWCAPRRSSCVPPCACSRQNASNLTVMERMAKLGISPERRWIMSTCLGNMALSRSELYDTVCNGWDRETPVYCGLMPP